MPASPPDRWLTDLLEHSQDILTVLDEEGRILYDSPAVHRLLGYAQGELVGRSVFEILHPEDLGAALGLLMDAVAQPGAPAALRVRVRHRGGGWRLLESAGTAGVGPDGRVGVVVNSRDVTGRAPLAASPGPAPRTPERERAELEMLDRLARAAELRDDDTGRHTRRVGELSAALAEALGLSDAEVETVRIAAPLHDVGKIGIPDAVLRKPGALLPDELRVMRTHPTLGAELLGGGGSAPLRAAEQIASAHHERWDGDGYPAGLRGEQIPLLARIVAVVDCYDALSHHRPYRRALPRSAALAEIQRSSGSHFDPRVAEAFLDLSHPLHEEREATPPPLPA